MEDMLDLKKSICQHADLQKTIIVRDETDVKSLVAMLQSHWLDPFTSVQQDLVCLSPGKVAPPKIQQDLLTAKAVGEKAYETFHIKRLKSQPSQIKFHDNHQSKAANNYQAEQKGACPEQNVQRDYLKADRNLFAQMILIAENRKLQMREVPSHPLGPLPWA